MKTTGLIVEYNPFHNGHAYHVEQSREKTNADVVICVMSGYFLQRGEPALLPRRNRTHMALLGGADLVVELPYIFSTQHASWFARGAISVLDHLGVDVVCFGSEHGSAEAFLDLLAFLESHENTYNDYIKKYSKEGYSYPKATSLAFQELLPNTEWPDLSKPNNILGYHYVRAIHELKSNMTAETIQRTKADYHDKELPGYSIASATSIRRSLLERQGTIDDIAHTIPKTTKEQLESFLNEESAFFDWERYFSFLQAKSLTLSSTDLAQMYEAEEGLHHRFQSLIKHHSTFDHFMTDMKTKRYTWTRLQRLAIQILTGTSKTEAHEALATGGADHIRVLGMNQTGRAYLNKIKKHVDIPLFTKMPNEKSPQQKLDEKAALAYYLPLSPSRRIKKWREEYSLPPIMI